jgi:hypothetical protein
LPRDGDSLFDFLEFTFAPFRIALFGCDPSISRAGGYKSSGFFNHLCIKNNRNGTGGSEYLPVCDAPFFVGSLRLSYDNLRSIGFFVCLYFRFGFLGTRLLVDDAEYFWGRSGLAQAMTTEWEVVIVIVVIKKNRTTHATY